MTSTPVVARHFVACTCRSAPLFEKRRSGWLVGHGGKCKIVEKIDGRRPGRPGDFHLKSAPVPVSVLRLAVSNKDTLQKNAGARESVATCRDADTGNSERLIGLRVVGDVKKRETERTSLSISILVFGMGKMDEASGSDMIISVCNIVSAPKVRHLILKF